jgi:hypothetical protein
LRARGQGRPVWLHDQKDAAHPLLQLLQRKDGPRFSDGLVETVAGDAASDRPSTARTVPKAGRPPAGGRLSFQLSARSHADQELRAVLERPLAEEELIDGRLDKRRELTDFVVEQLAAQLDFAVFIQRSNQ